MPKPKRTFEDKLEYELDAADSECEGENYHDRIGLARLIFEQLRRKKLLPEENLLKAAKTIRLAVSP